MRWYNGFFLILCLQRFRVSFGFDIFSQPTTEHICDEEEYAVNCADEDHREYCDVDDSALQMGTSRSICAHVNLLSLLVREKDYCGRCKEANQYTGLIIDLSDPQDEPEVSRNEDIQTVSPTLLKTNPPRSSPAEMPSSKDPSMPSLGPTYLKTNPPKPLKTSNPTTQEISPRPSYFPSGSSLPSQNPSDFPSVKDSFQPSSNPSAVPSDTPSITINPTRTPSYAPTMEISGVPSLERSPEPSLVPSGSSLPSLEPSSVPSSMPSQGPSDSSPPSPGPSSVPSDMPTQGPSGSSLPSSEPSSVPSTMPTQGPSDSSLPSLEPSSVPSDIPTQGPSDSSLPSLEPSSVPSAMPTQGPSGSSLPSSEPSSVPSTMPTQGPSDSSLPSLEPSSVPSTIPTQSPSSSSLPSSEPSSGPSGSSLPSLEPSSTPSTMPSNECLRGDLRYLEDRVVIDIEFNYPQLNPLPSDWVGIYPCEDAERNPPFNREPPLWAFTCYGRNCHLDPEDSATGIGSFTFDDMTKPSYSLGGRYKTIEQLIAEAPGCYVVMLNRIDGDNAPPYYEICQGNEIELLPPPTLSPSLEPSLIPSGSSLPSLEPSLSPSGSSLPSSEPSPSPSGSSLPSSEPSSSPSNSCVRGDVRYLEDRVVIDIEFNYPQLDPLPSDWVGIYPCEDTERNPPFNRQAPLWAYTCYGRNCRLDPDDSATGIGSFTFDDMTKPSYSSAEIYKTIGQLSAEAPGCYVVVLNRIGGDDAPPYYEICQGNTIELPALDPSPSGSSVPSLEPSSSPSAPRQFLSTVTPKPTLKHVVPIETCQQLSFHSSDGALSEDENKYFEEEILKLLESQWPPFAVSSVEVIDQKVEPANRFRRALRRTQASQLVNMKVFIQGFSTPDDDGSGESFENAVDRLFREVDLQDFLPIAYTSTMKLSLEECEY